MVPPGDYSTNPTDIHRRHLVINTTIFCSRLDPAFGVSTVVMCGASLTWQQRLCEVGISTNEHACIVFTYSVSTAWRLPRFDHCRCGDHEMTSLQVLVYLEAVVTGVRNHDVTVARDCETLRAVERVGRGADVRKERSLAVEHLRRTNIRKSFSCVMTNNKYINE